MIPGIETTPLASGVSLRVDASLDRGVVLDAGLRPAFVARGDGEQNLDRLFAPGALCITTGQQPGLLTGPLLTIHKALSAVALARRCEAALDRPVVPVFWVAGDDHDFAESNHLHLLNQDGAVERIALRERAPGAASVPMYREALGDDVTDVFARVRDITPETEFRDAELDWLRAHYRPENTVAGAFAGAMADLLGRYGLVVFQPTAHVAKEAAAPLFAAALDHADDLGRALADLADRLGREGRPAPVPVREGETLVMVESTKGRDRLVRDGAGVRTRRSAEPWPADAVRDALATDPQRFSANVLLRPAVEAALLPTLAYVGGPGEIAYLAQTGPVFETLDVAPQALVTRWSGRVIERRVQKTLDKYAIRPEDLRAQDGQLEGRLVQSGMPDEAGAALEAMRATLDAQYPRLVEATGSIDPTLQKPVRAAHHNALRELAGIEKRLVSRLKQRDETLLRQIAHARHAIYPHHEPQERVLNVLQYLVRYGGDYLYGLMSACEKWAATLDPPEQDR